MLSQGSVCLIGVSKTSDEWFCSSCRCCFQWPDDTQHDALTNAVSKNVVRLDVVVLSGFLWMR
jgi:hypothetical protein